jgi:hypothetical protein
LFNLMFVRYKAAGAGARLVSRGVRTGNNAALIEGGLLLLTWFLGRSRRRDAKGLLNVKPGTTMLVRVRRGDEPPLGVETARALLATPPDTPLGG